jgi:flagellar basal-body rod modification protein FlgD
LRKDIAMAIQALGKQAFLDLLTTQLQFQDPLKPMESTDFVAQLAQFRELESALETNKKLDSLVQGTAIMNNLNAAGLLGRTIQRVGGSISHTAEQSEKIIYRLNDDASEVVIHVANESGSVVKTLAMKELQGQGAHEVTWDGKDNNGNKLPAGNYTYAGASIDASGRSLPIEISTKGVVTGISYEDGKVLALVNGSAVPVGEIVKVMQ